MEQYSNQMTRAAVKRTYDASCRTATAEELRRHIVDTATPLFVEHGYELASMRLVADAAGVSPQTLYNAFGSKFGLFAAVMNVVVVGDHEPIAIAARPEVAALDAITDPDAFVRAIVGLALPILARVAEIYPTLRSAASSDREVAVAYQHFVIDGRYADQRASIARFAALRALPRKLDVDKATDVAWTVLSPDTYDLLVSHRGWTPKAFESWATDILLAELVSPRGRP